MIQRVAQLSPSGRLSWLRVTIASGLCGCVGITWSLWWDGRAPPRAPLPGIGEWLGWASPMFLVALGALMVRWLRTPIMRNGGLVIALGVLLVLGDFTRLQPWTFHLLVLVALTSVKRLDSTTWMLIGCVQAAMYAWSGVHKLNEEFFMVTVPTLLGDFGAYDWTDVQPWLLTTMAWALIGSELFIGVAFLLRPMRRWAVLVAALLHTAIIVHVLVANWDWNIIPWNMSSAVINVLVFIHVPEGEDAPTLDALLRGSRVRRVIVGALFGLGPFLHGFGAWHPEMGFALYTGNYDRARYVFRESAVSPEVWQLGDDVPPDTIINRNLFDARMVPGPYRSIELTAWVHQLHRTTAPTWRPAHRWTHEDLCRRFGSPEGLYLQTLAMRPWLVSRAPQEMNSCAARRIYVHSPAEDEATYAPGCPMGDCR